MITEYCWCYCNTWKVPHPQGWVQVLWRESEVLLFPRLACRTLTRLFIYVDFMTAALHRVSKSKPADTLADSTDPRLHAFSWHFFCLVHCGQDRHTNLYLRVSPQTESWMKWEKHIRRGCNGYQRCSTKQKLSFTDRATSARQGGAKTWHSKPFGFKYKIKINAPKYRK